MRELGEQQGSLQSTWGREGEEVEGEAPARLIWVNDSEWEPNEGLVVVVAKVVGGCCMVVLDFMHNYRCRPAKTKRCVIVLCSALLCVRS